MGRTLYLECASGISGDMVVGSLLDLGADKQLLSEILATVKAESFKISYKRISKSGLDCMDFDVVSTEHHHHDHEHEHHEHEHHHSHRSIGEINEILEKTALNDKAKALAKKIYGILAESESKAHDVPIDQVHFHEVGRIGAIVQVIAIAFCIDNLDIDKVIVPKLYEGQGSVRVAHGILPVPVPAVANIVSNYKIPMEILNIQGELVTPTGAATVAALRTSGELPKEFVIEKIGMGSGKKDYGLAGFLRAMLIDDTKG